MPNNDGILNTYSPQRDLKVLEHIPTGWSAAPGVIPDGPIRSNVLLFVGGLYDVFHNVPFVRATAKSLPQGCPWSVMEIQLSSSGRGWATCDLDKDVEEIAECVTWLRTSGVGRVVLMGHSTGSQDVLHYLYHDSSKGLPELDGAILQAPVSDREALHMHINGKEDVNEREQLRKLYENCVSQARAFQRNPSNTSLRFIPPEASKKLGFGYIPISATRFLSLASPDSPDRPSMDDLFSSDLSDQRLSTTFGMVGKMGRLNRGSDQRAHLLILMSGADQYVPKSIDKYALLKRWTAALEENSDVGLDPASMVLPDATHNASNKQEELASRVIEYLGRIGANVPLAGRL